MFSPYPDYRQTDLNWFEYLPNSWTVLRTKQLFRLIIEKAPANNQKELLSVYTHIGVRPRKSLEQRGNKASTTDGYWVVKKGDIISNKLLAWMGAIGVSHYEGVTSPAYDVLRPIKSCNTDYYHFLFRTKKYLQQFKIRSRGIMDMRLRLYFDQFGQIPIPVPPRPEQDQIVAYLRAQDAHIARFIQAKRELIKLLTEQKLRIIDHAITRGLNVEVALKPSGNQWLGEVSVGWTVCRLKAELALNDGGCWGDDPVGNEGTPVLRSTEQAVDGSWRIKSPALRRLSEHEAHSKRLQVGDLVVTKSSGSEKHIGKTSLVTKEVEELGCCFSNFMLRLRPKQSIKSKWIWFLLNSRVGRDQMAFGSNSTTGLGNLTREVVGNIWLALPPLVVQDQLIPLLEKELHPIDSAINQVRQQIALIREYRDRLIADVVTGQVDVRGWQPGPEDVVDETALAALGDDSEDMTDEEDGDGED